MRHIYLIISLVIFVISHGHASETKLDTVPNVQNMGMGSTAWTNFSNASPSEHIPFIDIPAPSASGGTNISFPIKLPEARNNHAPELNITYSTEGVNGWLGIGWDLSLSSITLDTRWGVPTFNNSIESEIYLLDGEQLGPVFHRKVSYPRVAEREFRMRQEVQFNRIIRHGSLPSNYWWEVREKNGTIHYYGGNPTSGHISNYTLQTTQGQITEWHPVESIDIYGNLISYTYQKTNFQLGKNIYPKSIKYNGFEGREGNYRIDFLLKQGSKRKDITASARTGMLQVEADLLDRVKISYGTESIRSYQLTYDSLQFKKTGMISISELDKNDDLFYTYEMGYYNDVMVNDTLKVFGKYVEWGVPKDNIAFSSISGSIDLFDTKPTLLGGALSKSSGGGLAVTVGPPFNPVTKDYSVGPNFTTTNSTSEGLISLIDINGDGLPDKVYKKSDGLYFRPNLHIPDDQVRGFGFEQKIQGINTFSSSRTGNWTVGAEVNLAPGFAAYFHEWSTTTVTSYFADFNGDELIDIAHNGAVYFNHIEDGIPVFTTNSSDTPSILYEDENSTNPDDVDPIDQNQLQQQNPLHDAVRVWTAPFAGTVRISGEVSLIEDSSPEAQKYQFADGVFLFIQVENTNLWIENIEPNDYSPHTPSGVENINVLAGDQIYFRVHSKDDGLYDQVTWDPKITYLNQDLTTANISCIPRYEYQASKDFLLSERSESIFPADGLIQVKGILTKPELADTIQLVVKGENEYQRSLKPEEVINGEFIIDSIPVSANERLSFHVVSRTNVDWAATEWYPTAEYIEFSNGDPTTDDSGKPVFTTCPKVEYEMFPVIIQYAEPWVASDSGTLSVVVTTPYINIFSPNEEDQTHVALKKKNQPDSLTSYIKTTAVDSFGQVIGIDHQLSIKVLPGDSIYLDIYEEPTTGFLPQVHYVAATFEGEEVDIVQGVAKQRRLPNDERGHNYRAWNQFAYNAYGDIPLFPMFPEDLSVDTTDVAQDTTLIDPDVTTGEVDGTNLTSDSKYIVMTTDPKQMAWRGSDGLTYIDRFTMSSTRYGLKNINDQGANNQNASLKAYDLITKTDGDAGVGGLGVGPAEGSAGYTGMETWSERDIGDMNGDKYPDIIDKNQIQYTTQRGRLSDRKFSHSWGTHVVNSGAWVVGLGRNTPNSSAKNAGASPGKGSNKRASRTRQKGRSSSTKSRNGFKSAKNSVGINGSFSSDSDEAQHSFIDINGDGLEDKIWNNGDVALNLGYSFANKQNWGFGTFNSGSAIDYGGGLGISISNGSIQSGFSVSRTENQAEIGFIDINDDALLDLIVEVEPLVVRMNTGLGFGSLDTLLNAPNLDQGVAIGESLNGAFTFCLEFFFFRICFNPSAYTGQGSSGVRSALQDVDGDGYLDLLRAEEDDANLSVKKNQIGRTNYLKSISNPFNGHYVIDYELVGNDYDLPFSKWVISSVEIEDGHSGDGVDRSRRTYQLANGKYDRHERQFYGFETITESHLVNDKVERKIVSEYHNDSYYIKGLKKSHKIYDAADQLMKESTNRYYLADVSSGIPLPLSHSQKDDALAFPALAKTEVIFYEGNAEGLSLINEYTYDTLGNVIQSVEIDEVGGTLTTDYTYQYDFDRYFVNQITSESVKDSDSRIVRLTEFDLDDKGNKLSIRRKIDENQYQTTTFTYDEYGNVLTLSRPANYRGQSLQSQMIYDEKEHQYLVSETDGYGYERSYTYEYLFNQLTSSTDLNHNMTTYTHDAKGRTSTITYPFETQEGRPYSIKYEYYPKNLYPYAVAQHYDPTRQDYISTYLFEDGLGRTIQLKTYAELHQTDNNSRPAYIVSGTDIWDALGRQIQNYLPITEDIGSPEIFNTQPKDSLSLRTEYDALDRPTMIEDSYGNIHRHSYNINQDNLGQSYLTTTITDPHDNTSTQYYNTRGQLVATRYDGPTGDIWTNYTYDDLSQIVKVTDTYGNETNYTYDCLGRRITVNTPDAGLTELTYDKADNLLSRRTSTIREVINVDGLIKYSYDHERLVQIDYPKNFQNKVQIHYGSPQDSFNRAGRIWLQEDASGGREYFFDANGNPTKEVRTVMINRSNVFTYVTETEYDSWGRILHMYYPDGEHVEYGYNSGGRLSTMKGTKSEKEQIFIEYAGYDRYGDRIKTVYGNNTSEEVSYDKKGRLHSKVISDASDKVLAEMAYSYNETDQVLTQTSKGISESGMGGDFSEEFTYDELYRMTTANGQWNGEGTEDYDLFFEYDNLNNLTMKSQNHNRNDDKQVLTSRIFDYQYTNESAPTRPSEVGGLQYNYDPNGNLVLRNSQAIFNYDQHFFDEENRMIGVSNNGYISRYTYDAFGQRTIKSHGESQGVFINGAPAGFIEHTINYKVNVSPYFTAYEHDYRKHYFIDGSRFLTKIGTGIFETNLANAPEVTAGGIDYKTRIQAYESSILDYYGFLGVSPGPPSLLALLGQPEINATSLPDANSTNPYTSRPPDWPTISPPDTLGPPGAPVFYEFADLNSENVKAGFNFSDGSITHELENFYYHYNRQMNTTYVTDYAGEPRQYATYFPSGERWINQQVSMDSTEYFFNSLNLDTETGYYNLGNSYYDPTTNINLSIDPVLQSFGHNTFKKRIEGDFYYDHANFESETFFDSEIINSEKPQPFLGAAINRVVPNGPEEKDVYRYSFKSQKEEQRETAIHKKKRKRRVKRKVKRKRVKKKQVMTRVNREVSKIIKDFKAQDSNSPEAFYYPNLPSFTKMKVAEQKHKKKLKRQRMLRKKRQKSKRKVRFK